MSKRDIFFIKWTLTKLNYLPRSECNLKVDGAVVYLSQRLPFDLHDGPFSKKVYFITTKSILKTFSKDKFNILDIITKSTLMDPSYSFNNYQFMVTH